MTASMVRCASCAIQEQQLFAQRFALRFGPFATVFATTRVHTPCFVWLEKPCQRIPGYVTYACADPRVHSFSDLRLNHPVAEQLKDAFRI